MHTYSRGGMPPAMMERSGADSVRRIDGEKYAINVILSQAL